MIIGTGTVCGRRGVDYVPENLPVKRRGIDGSKNDDSVAAALAAVLADIANLGGGCEADFVPRQVVFTCQDCGHLTVKLFNPEIPEADIPLIWDCEACHKDAKRPDDGSANPEKVDGRTTRFMGGSHLGRIKERRDPDEVERILAEALDNLHNGKNAGGEKISLAALRSFLRSLEQ
ncbi:MAG: RNA polymerase-binding protein RbpA [Candidatus Nomurabacteria bacterium]|jgi:hypothetical protein|nr:RNA polymerase-binding protein RbpA [Candidatus Nomurabacteria bacterium]